MKKHPIFIPKTIIKNKLSWVKHDIETKICHYMKIGYARVSTNDQNLNRQLDQLSEYGCERIFQEKITGSQKERPELNRMIDCQLPFFRTINN